METNCEKELQGIDGNKDLPDNEKIISCEVIDEFIKNVNSKKEVKIEHFNIYKRIKKENHISPLMIFILEKAIDKYNNKLENDIGLENVGFGYFPGINNQEKDNNNAYFNSNDAFVLYVSFSEKLIGIFWSNHQLLADLLLVNPDKSVLSSQLNLATSEINKSKNSNSKKSNNSNNKSTSSQNSNIQNEQNNKEFYKLSLGENFEYNSLLFLLHGIKTYINLPRIIFYPLIEYKDYEELDSAFLVKEMKDSLSLYYSNFKSIDLDNYNNNRKQFKLEANDLVFVEATFEIDSKKDKVLNFMTKIIKFIELYINIGLIKELNDYKIKPILLYDNDYNLKEKDINNIKTAIDTLKEIIEKSNNDILNEIRNNLQRI